MTAWSDTQLVADGTYEKVVSQTYEATLPGTSAVSAKNSGVIDAQGVSVTTHGDETTGVLSTGPGSIINYANGTIETTGRLGVGVKAYDGGSVVLENSFIQTAGVEGHGVQTGGTANGAVVTMKGGGITTSGDKAIAFQVRYGGVGDVDGAVFKTTGYESQAVQVLRGEFRGTGLVLDTQGDKSSGAAARFAGSTLALRNSVITTSGIGSVGVSVAEGARGDITDTSIRTDGNDAPGVVATDAGSVLRITGGQIISSGTGSTGAVALNGATVQLNNVSVMSEKSRGVVAADAGSVLNALGGSIRTTGVNAAAAEVLRGAAMQLDGASVRTEGANAWAAKVDGKFVMNGGTLISAQHGAIVATGDSVITLNDGAQAIGGNDTLLSISDEASNVTFALNNGALAKGDIVFGTSADSNADGSLERNSNVSLTNGAHWIGKTDAVGGLALGLDSQWSMTGSSSVDQLDMDRGRVIFAAPDMGGFKTLTIKNDLTGNGTFFINTDLSTLQGDLLKIDGQISGNHTLIVADSGLEASGEKLMLVDGNGGSGKFDLYGGHVDAGAFRYGLEQRGDNWYLEGAEHKTPDDLSSGANAAVGRQAATAALISAQMNSLVKRLGELRMGKDDGGLWTRGFSKDQRIDTGSSRGFQQQVNGIEIGADKALPYADGKIYVGGMVGQGHATQNFGERTKGTTDSVMLGGYATYVDRSGLYIDSVLKFTHLNNKIEITNNVGDKNDAKYKNHAVSADIEVGKRINLKQGWFVEPQLEVQMLQVSTGNYTASNGLKVKQDALTSVQSRVGGLLGRNLKLENSLDVQPYAKASWINEHAGESKVKVNGNSLDSKLPGSRAEIGGGVIVQLADKHKFSIDGEYAKGSSIEQPWAVTVGYRYTW
ncbi:autotransporter outer membrane beta-barrel domain-containing protein [Pseudomonas pergaminensis]